ncbi:MAG: hypothetical protein GY906_14415 [bacterium]|nr:hypothetical protein [bacterium]
MSTRKTDRDLMDAVFGDGETTQHHIADDREEMRRLEQLKSMLSEHGHREPPESRREHLWSRLEDRLDEAPTRSWLLSFLYLRPALMSATAILTVAIAVFVVWLAAPQGNLQPEPSIQIVEAEIEAGDRLDTLIRRATPLLMAVSNRSDDDELHAIDISIEQRLATKLAAESRVLRETSESALPRRDQRLVAELEGVLMQVANTNPSVGGNEIALLRETIEDRQLLFEFALRELKRSDALARPERSRDA